MAMFRNSVYNLLGAVIPVAVTLATVPILLNAIGEARYGVLALVWLIVGYSALFDFGLGRATTQRISALEKSEKGSLASTFWTAVIVNAGFGLLGFAIVLTAIYAFFGYIDLAPNLRSEIRKSFFWIAMMVPVVTLSSTLNGVLTGRQRFLELNLISTISLALTQIAPLACALLIGPELNLLIPVTVCARALMIVVLFQRCYWDLGRGQRPTVARAEATILLRFGSWVAITSLIGPLMIIMDRFVIGALSGAAAVALYTIPFQLAERTTLVTRAIVATLFPVFSGQSESERERLGQNSQSVIIGLSTPIAVFAILLVGPFLALWISPEFARDTALVAIILLVGFWLNGIGAIPYAILQAKGRPDLVAKCHAAELIPYLILLFVGLNFFGIPGAAGAFFVRVLADVMLLTVLARQTTIVRARIIVPISVVIAALLIANGLQPWSYLWSAAIASLAIITGIWSWFTLRRHIDFRRVLTPWKIFISG